MTEIVSKKAKIEVWINQVGYLNLLSFDETATIQTVLDCCKLDIHEVVITYDDTEILESCRLVDYSTSVIKPICISTFLVYFSIDVSYVCFANASKLSSLNYFIQTKLPVEDDWVAMHNEMLVNDKNVMTPLLNLPTSPQRPLMIRHKSKYVKLPEGVSLELALCETVEDLCRKLEAVTRKSYIVGHPNSPHDKSDLLALIIFSLRANQKLQVVVKPSPEHKFKYGSMSASSAVQDEAKRTAVINEGAYYKVYSNWFAMEVVDNLNADDASLDLALTVKKMLQFDNYSSYGRFANHELLFTANLCDALTKFLQHDNHCCLHQVTLHTSSRPDFYVVSLQNGVPHMPKLVGDFKMSEKDKARAETLVYCEYMIHKSKNNLPIFAMSGCCEMFWLYLCIPEPNKKLACIAIAEEVKVSDQVELAKLFSAMKYGVTNLKPLEMFGNKLFSFRPIRELEFTYMDALNHSWRVFKRNGMVYKLYDPSSCFKPNHGHIQLLDTDSQQYLPDLKVTRLPAGYMMLQYRYIEETKVAPVLAIFRSAFAALEKLHEKGIVHSDVRARNIVFTTDGIVKFIDFDLAGKVDENYPENYNHLLEERHPDAQPKKARHPFHDHYALITIMLSKVHLRDDQRKHLEKCRKDEKVSVEGIFNGID